VSSLVILIWVNRHTKLREWTVSVSVRLTLSSQSLTDSVSQSVWLTEAVAWVTDSEWVSQWLSDWVSASHWVSHLLGGRVWSVADWPRVSNLVYRVFSMSKCTPIVNLWSQSFTVYFNFIYLFISQTETHLTFNNFIIIHGFYLAARMGLKFPSTLWAVFGMYARHVLFSTRFQTADWLISWDFYFYTHLFT